MVKYSEKETAILERVKNTIWFVSYEKDNNRDKTRKLIKKIKEGIKKGKYKEYYQENREKGEDERGFIKPKQKKQKKATKEKQTQIAQAITKKGKLTRKEKELKRQHQLALKKGKKYSKEEVREGINSKRAIAYRKRHGITDRGKENE